MIARLRPRLALLTSAGLAAIVLTLLLVPHHVDLPIAWLSASHLLGDAADGGTPLWWAIEDLANVALFVPLGWAFARWLRRAVPAILIGTAISAACETAQHFIPNRDGSLLDVTMNAIGTCLGALLAVRRLRRSGDASLSAARARPVRFAGARLDRVHAREADGAVRGGEGDVVVRSRMQRGAGGQVAASAVVLGHSDTVPRPHDINMTGSACLEDCR